MWQERQHQQLIAARERVDQNASVTVKQSKMKRQLSLMEDSQ